MPVVVDTGITVTDVDDTHMASGTVTVGTGYAGGQDVLAFTNQNGITGSYSAPTMTLTGSATKANWQTALRSITYNNTSDAPNTAGRTINFVVNDGTSNSNTAAKTVSVATVNDAPVNSMPAGQSTNMNIAEVFSGGSLISITDDASSGDMRVQLVSTNGASTLSTLTGLSFTVGDGTADATMTFDGTVAEVNAALNGLSFNPTTSFIGAASLQIVTSDQGNTGTGGTLTDNDTVAITVAPPDLGIFTANQDIGGPGTAGSSSHSAGTYTVAGGGSDIWNNADQFQFLSMPMTGDGRLTAKVVSQTQTPTTSNAAKAGVMFRETLAAGSIHGMMDVMKANGSEFHWRLTTNGPSAATTVTTGIAAPYWVRITRVGNIITGERSPDGVNWTQQGATQSIPMTSSIYVGLAVSAVDNTKLNTATFSNVTFEQPPVLAASGGTTAHTENVPVVVDSGITVTDATSANMASGTVTVGSGYTAGQDVLAFTTQNGITGSWSAPTMTLTGSATKANWQTALQSVTYNNTSNAPNTGNRTINFVVNDGSFDSNTGAKTVSVAAVNDAPVNTVPGAQTTAMNTAKVFSTGNGNLISIADVDAASRSRSSWSAPTARPRCSDPDRADVHGRRRHRGRHDDVQRNRRRGQHRAERAELQPDHQLHRCGQPADHHQRPGQHRHGRHPDRQRHGRHHGRVYHLLRHDLGRVVPAQLLPDGRAPRAPPIDDIEPRTTTARTPIRRRLAQAGAIAGNNSVLFNGTDEYVSITSQIPDDFSIEFWFKSTQGIGHDRAGMAQLRRHGRREHVAAPTPTSASH